MRNGPITQFSTSETPNIFQAVATFESSSYFTFAKTGYIIQSKPIAMGRETASISSAESTIAISG